MRIDFNETEQQAMDAFFRGDSEEGHKLQDQFLADVLQSIKEGQDHCPCKDNSCKHHGHCMQCVQIHRGHGMHLPYCMQLMLNKRLAYISELTEHTIVNEVEIPDYLK